MPKVSFVLPAYKRRFLKEAIESILAQTYKDLELIVVDDHSPENLREVVEQFADNRLSYHRNERNLGGRDLVEAWTLAMSFAKGEWCVLASDDDKYEPEYVAEMLGLAEQFPKSNVFHCRVRVIDGNGRLIGMGEPRAEWESCLELLYYRNVKRFTQLMPDFMFRRSRWIECGGFVSFPTAWYSDDATWVKLSIEGGVGYSIKPLFNYRCSGINISSTPTRLEEKMEACYLFGEWARKLAEEAVPVSEEDKLFRQKVIERVERECLNSIYGLASHYTFFAFCKMLRRVRVSPKIKTRLILNRIAYYTTLKNLVGGR